ncbi:hypothetical protein LCGC14_0251090 [marine sediment metagenome]|uniref:Uncharacterized protein n=1 Tax=marine sediment metagenome TaxID=412755 RepID=A0A0F9UKU3_9ZZZZ
MPLPVNEPKVLILDLIEAKWLAANVVGDMTPDFHTGWWNPRSLRPQITFTNQDEVYQGVSGYGAIGAAGPVQIADGTLSVNCWAVRDEGAGGTNPKKLVREMAEEVRRIILANVVLVTNLEYVSVLSVVDVAPVAGNKPVVFRKSITVGFNWSTT